MNKIILSLSLLLVCFTLFAKEKNQTVIRYKAQPWMSNSAYIDDYMLGIDSIEENLSSLAPDKYKKCKTIKSKFSRVMCLDSLSLRILEASVLRGSPKYVNENYEFLRGKGAKELVTILKGMDSLRNKTRFVQVGDRPEKGELTYQMINREICIVEDTIGRLRKKSFCHR